MLRKTVRQGGEWNQWRGGKQGYPSQKGRQPGIG
jgi:hypothetical protein